jgi:hypothetical protein
MYYEEKIIDHILCARTSPNGEFTPVKNDVANAVNSFILLKERDRGKAMSYIIDYYNKSIRDAG